MPGSTAFRAVSSGFSGTSVSSGYAISKPTREVGDGILLFLAHYIGDQASSSLVIVGQGTWIGGTSDGPAPQAIGYTHGWHTFNDPGGPGSFVVSNAFHHIEIDNDFDDVTVTWSGGGTRYLIWIIASYALDPDLGAISSTHDKAKTDSEETVDPGAANDPTVWVDGHFDIFAVSEPTVVVYGFLAAAPVPGDTQDWANPTVDLDPVEDFVLRESVYSGDVATPEPNVLDMKLWLFDSTDLPPDPVAITWDPAWDNTQNGTPYNLGGGESAVRFILFNPGIVETTATGPSAQLQLRLLKTFAEELPYMVHTRMLDG